MCVNTNFKSKVEIFVYTLGGGWMAKVEKGEA